MKAMKFQYLLAAFFILLIMHGCKNTNHTHDISPAYRPYSEMATEFVEALRNSTVAVYPSIIRTQQKTSYSTDSQGQIIQLLTEQQLTTPVAETEQLAPGPLKSPPQWDIFVHDLHNIADSIGRIKPDARYHLVLEIVFSPGNESVWGIHYYVLDRQGNNAFSFLLNSHHQLFRSADLHIKDTSAKSRARLIENATKVGVTALVQQVNAPAAIDMTKHRGYSIMSQKIAPFDQKVDRIFIQARIHERLRHVFMRSLKHSLESGLEANGIESVIKLMPRDSADYSQFQNELEAFSPDAVMYVDIDPLLRERRDGHQAIVGTDFNVQVIDNPSGRLAWKAAGKVDYIKMFGSKYTAHEGIRKEFAWHTTAAIVRTFVLDVNGHESAPIYTVTEERQLYQQRTD